MLSGERLHVQGLQTHNRSEHRVQLMSGSTSAFSSRLAVTVLKKTRLVWKLPVTKQKYFVPQDPAGRCVRRAKKREHCEWIFVHGYDLFRVMRSLLVDIAIQISLCME